MIQDIPHVRCKSCGEFRSSPMFAMLMPPAPYKGILKPGEKDMSKAPAIEPFCTLCAMRVISTVLTILLGMTPVTMEDEGEGEPN